MYWDVIEVTPEADLTLSVRFEDGVTGKVGFLSSHLTGVFTPLKRADFFKKVFIRDGIITWPGEIDLAPDAMHDILQTQSEWVLA